MSPTGRLVRHVVSIALGAAAIELRAGTPLAAQIVRGVVTERATNAPLAGVLLSVLDARDTVLVQALSNEGGAFEIRLPSAGTFSLDVKRIGVKRTRVAPFPVAEGETRRIDVVVEPLAAVLSSLRITGRTSCVRNPETNARTA